MLVFSGKEQSRNVGQNKEIKGISSSSLTGVGQNLDWYHVYFQLCLLTRVETPLLFIYWPTWCAAGR